MEDNAQSAKDVKKGDLGVEIMPIYSNDRVVCPYCFRKTYKTESNHYLKHVHICKEEKRKADTKSKTNKKLAE